MQALASSVSTRATRGERAGPWGGGGGGGDAGGTVVGACRRPRRRLSLLEQEPHKNQVEDIAQLCPGYQWVGKVHLVLL